MRSPADASAGSVNVLLARSMPIDPSPRAQLLSQVEFILYQLHTATLHGMLPSVFLGSQVLHRQHCRTGSSNLTRYFDRQEGENIWNYYFEPVSAYRLGSVAPGGRSARMFVASSSDTARLGEAPTLGGEEDGDDALKKARDPAMQKLVQMSRLVRRFVRIKAPVRAAAHQLLQEWRTRSADRIVGVALGSPAPAGLDVVHKLVEQFLHRSCPGNGDRQSRCGLILLLGATEDHVAEWSSRHGRERVVSLQSLHGVGGGEGRHELLDALLLAHANLLLSVGAHPVEFRFAMWYNPWLHDSLLQVDAAASSWASLPAPTKPRVQIARHTQAMLDALLHPHDVDEHSRREAADDVFIPGLAPAPPARKEADGSWIAIDKGTCSSAKARRMTSEECSSYASAAKKHYLGSSVDRNEYPGCTLWEDTQLVEFNAHAHERGRAARCNHGGRGKCICKLLA